MSEHFVIKNIRRSIKEAQSRKGMIVGLPEIRIPASHAEVLLGEIDRLKADLEEAQELVAREHKRGWEQAKAEAKDAVECADYDADDWSRRNPEHVAVAAIAAMEYGGKAND